MIQKITNWIIKYKENIRNFLGAILASCFIFYLGNSSIEELFPVLVLGCYFIFSHKEIGNYAWKRWERVVIIILALYSSFSFWMGYILWNQIELNTNMASNIIILLGGVILFFWLYANIYVSIMKKQLKKQKCV